MKPTKEEIKIVRKIKEDGHGCAGQYGCKECPLVVYLGHSVEYSCYKASKAFLKKYDKKEKPYQKVNLGKRPEGELYLDDITDTDHIAVKAHGVKYIIIRMLSNYFFVSENNVGHLHGTHGSDVLGLLEYTNDHIDYIRRYEDRKELYRWLSK